MNSVQNAITSNNGCFYKYLARASNNFKEYVSLKAVSLYILGMKVTYSKREFLNSSLFI